MFDGVEMPRVRRLSARQMRSRRAVPVLGLQKSRSCEVHGDKDRYGDTDIGNVSDEATASFYLPSDSDSDSDSEKDNNSVKTPTGRNIPKEGRIRKRNMSLQSFPRGEGESSLSVSGDKRCLAYIISLR